MPFLIQITQCAKLQFRLHEKEQRVRDVCHYDNKPGDVG